MRFIIVLHAAIWPLFVSAQDMEVDLELFLAVDVSRSMSPEELDIQRRGYAEALTSPEVTAALQSGPLGRIALTYVEWAENHAQRVIVPWTLIEKTEDAAAIAARLTASFDPSLRRTSISGALDHAAKAFDGNGFAGLRQVIDISGDGPNNQGRPVLEARSDVLGKGITINGLPLMTEDAFSNIWGIPDLDVYYAECVIGGVGAFVIPVHGWAQFPDAVRRKLVLEIADLTIAPRVFLAQATPEYDCMVGEKMWRQNRSYFDIP
ncbi:DUF1194 domain-containing protein [Sulfitobacter aestuariivivens]|uniref:DUF1194 domain-containing protein n=1 Tax=Sulfitobacter aestuariivivens TaxID=2766981 RepID=A0A927HDC1_9RHOB|nr:DUF1194 domain-containing protein [Sulfitobacter aestuariivivens]MBD3663517.1 DUF1194 domain-containing protein [Sulfitobacter aestuariivivens]